MSKPVVKRVGVRKPRTAGQFSFDLSDAKSISQTLQESEALRGTRLSNLESYLQQSMPTLEDEAWRRTDIRSIPAEDVSIKPSLSTPVDPAILEPLIEGVDPAFMLLRPGQPSEITAPDALTDQGVLFTDFRTAAKNDDGFLEEYLGSVVNPEDGKFAALAGSAFSDGVVVRIPAGTDVSVPLHSVIWAPGDEHAFFSRLLIVVEEGASVTWAHEFASPTLGGHSLHSGIVELIVKDRARLNFIEIQNWGKQVWNITHERASVGKDASIDWIFGAVGTRLTKNFSELNLEGEGAEGRMSGFYFTDGIQHLDHDTQQNHLAPNTTSDLLFKGGLVDNSRSVWQGMIYVAPGAQRTDGFQANRNLLLDESARADSIPGLEILADDVRCTHGATVSQLDEEPVFYLMSRGLPRADAERLVVDGFFAEVLERIPFEPVRKRMLGMIENKMGRSS